jgi:hypothetical protein
MRETKPKRRWFRFSLRTLFVLVTIACLPMIWMAYQLKWIHERRQFWENYGFLFGAVTVDGEQTPWSLRIFGDYAYPWNHRPPSDIERAKALFPEMVSHWGRPDAIKWPK